MNFARRAGLIGARLRAIHESQGLSGLATFAWTRLYQRREDVLFEMDLGEESWNKSGPNLEPVVVVGRNNVGSKATADIERQILRGDNVAYRPGLEADDLLFAHVDDAGQVDTYAFVLFDTPYKRVLQVPIATPLIGNCYTVPACRGRGLYPRMLRTVCEYLASRSFQRVVISCAPENTASINGIGRSGFVEVRRTTTWVLLSRVVISRRILESG